MPIADISEHSWQGILQVQKEAYTDIPHEELIVLKSKWKVSPKTCFVYQDNKNKVLAYLLAHPWNENEPPPLFEILPQHPTRDTLYIHDLAVSNDARNLGIGKKLTNKLLELAELQKFKRVLLVAVQGTEDYWFNFGFRVVKDLAVSPSYGSQAKLMSCKTPP